VARSEGLPEESSEKPNTRRLKLGAWVMPAGLHTFDAFGNPAFRLLFLAVSGAGGGYWIQQVVVGWLIYDVTESPFLTSVALGLEAVPLLIMGPFGGFLVDVLDRRKLLTGVYIYQGTLALALALGVIFDYVGSGQIFAFLLLVGFSWVITEPARASLTANIVPKEGLINAYALSTLGWGITRLAVPVVGGFLIGELGGGPTLFLEALLFYMGAAFAFSVRVRGSRTERPKLSAVVPGLLEGARYVKDHRVVLALLIFGLTTPMLIFPFVTGLLPVYAAEVYHVGPAGLGLLMSVSGVGMVVGTLIVASLGNVRYKGKLVVGSVFMAGVMMAVFSSTKSYVAGLLILAAMNTVQPFLYTTIQGTIQSIIPDELRGRISGLSMVTWGAFPLGSVLAGVLAQNLGSQMATLIGAGILGVCLIILLRIFTFMWRME
jgi:MFS family permease